MQCSWRHKATSRRHKGHLTKSKNKSENEKSCRSSKTKRPLHLKGSAFIHDNQCLRGSTSIHDNQHRLVGSAFNEKVSTFIHDNQCLRITHIVAELYVGDGPSAGPSEFRTGPSAYRPCAGISNLEGPALRPFSYTKFTPPTRCIGN